MSETRFNEALNRWDLVVEIPFSNAAMQELKDIHGIDGTKELISIAFEGCMERFAVELAKTGVDKNLIAKAACERGCGKIPIGKALGLLNPKTS